MKGAAAGALLAALPALAWAAPAPAPSGLPAPGRHAVDLCVATLPKPPSCGAALVDRRADGSLRWRVDDVVDHLRFHRSQVEVIVMHNIVQIDAFRVPYEWVGHTLQFKDQDRHSVYEIRFAPNPPAAKS